MIATNEFQLQVARQTAKGAYPAAPTYALRVVSGGLSSKPTVDQKKVGDGSFWTTALKRTGYIETGGEPVLICDPNSLGLIVYGGMGTDTAGVPEADIEVARRVGCTKVNIDTDLRMAMTAAIRKVLFEKPKEFDPRKYLGPARKAVKDLVRHKVKNVLCCSGHAFD